MLCLGFPCLLQNPKEHTPATGAWWPLAEVAFPNFHPFGGAVRRWQLAGGLQVSIVPSLCCHPQLVTPKTLGGSSRPCRRVSLCPNTAPPCKSRCVVADPSVLKQMLVLQPHSSQLPQTAALPINHPCCAVTAHAASSRRDLGSGQVPGFMLALGQAPAPSPSSVPHCPVLQGPSWMKFPLLGVLLAPCPQRGARHAGILVGDK